MELDFSVAKQGQHKRSRLTWRGFKYARCGKPNGTVWNRLKNKRGRFIEKTGENQTQTRCVIWCLYFSHNISVFGLPWWLSSKESACNAEDTGDKGFIPGSGRSPGGENGNPFQYSCLKNPMDRRAWQATVQRITESDTTEQLSKHISAFTRSTAWFYR